MDPSQVSDPPDPAGSDDEVASATVPPPRAPPLASWLGWSLPPAHREASLRVQRSRQLYEQARRASRWTPEAADTAGLLRKAIHQLAAALARLTGPPPSTYPESQALLDASADLRQLFADIWDDLPWLDELVSGPPLAGDDRDKRSQRYMALLERMPAVYRAASRQLERAQRQAGLRPLVRRIVIAAGWLTVCAAVLLVPLLVTRGGESTGPGGEVGQGARIRPGPVEPRQVLDDPRRCFQATYFGMVDFRRPVATRRDCLIEFDWGMASVTGIPALPADSFSVRWEGVLTAPRSEAYVFYLVSDDGARLFLDDQIIIDNWGNHGLVERASEPVDLREGEGRSLRVDYYDARHSAAVQLMWSSPTIGKRSVAGRYISPPRGAPVSRQRAD